MSRIGKMPVDVPAKVKVTVQGSVVSAEGPKGKLNLTLRPSTSAKVVGTQVSLSRQGEGAEAKAMHGLARALVNNMVRGVNEGYQKKLEIQGVGFKAAVQGISSIFHSVIVIQSFIPSPRASRSWSRRIPRLRSMDATRRSLVA
jgi:ribosomal protein L6P/L9E